MKTRIVWLITFRDSSGNVQIKHYDGLSVTRKREIYHELLVNGYEVIDMRDMDFTAKKFAK